MRPEIPAPTTATSTRASFRGARYSGSFVPDHQTGSFLGAAGRTLAPGAGGHALRRLQLACPSGGLLRREDLLDATALQLRVGPVDGTLHAKENAAAAIHDVGLGILRRCRTAAPSPRPGRETAGSCALGCFCEEGSRSSSSPCRPKSCRAERRRAYLYCSQNFESAGSSSTQGGHQVAQKWTTKRSSLLLGEVDLLAVAVVRSAAPERQRGTGANPLGESGGTSDLIQTAPTAAAATAKVSVSSERVVMRESRVAGVRPAGLDRARRRRPTRQASWRPGTRAQRQRPRAGRTDVEDSDPAEGVVESHRILPASKRAARP